MKKNTILFLCFVALSLFIVNLITPIDRLSHEVVSLTIDLLQPDETFKIGEIKLSSLKEPAPQVSEKVSQGPLVQSQSRLSKEAGYEWV